LLVTVLFASAVRLPASVCPFKDAPIGKACQMGCCANKCCCVQLQKKQNPPSTPLAKDDALNAQPALAIAAIPTAFVIPPQSFGISPHKRAIFIADSALRPALLCTFLI
jgi:hypothetical protein